MGKDEGLTPRQQVLAIAPLLGLGLLAVCCLIAVGDVNKSSTRTELYLGSSEEAASKQAVDTAAAIYPDQITAKNPPVDDAIMKEVQKAEEEQATEMRAEADFASGKDRLTSTKKSAPAAGATAAGGKH